MTEIRERLKGIRPERRRYSSDQVNWIREQYLIEKRPIPEITKELWPVSGENAIYRIAIGLSYDDVPLSAKLIEAYTDAQKRRELPPPPGGRRPVPLAGPVRAEELLGEEEDESWS